MTPHIHDPLILASLASEVGLEEWRNVPGYTDLYQVSNLGKIRSKTQLIKPVMSGRYLKFAPSKDGAQKLIAIHIQVMLAFAGERPTSNTIVRHILDDRNDNRLCSLAYGTHKQNGEDKVKNGMSTKGEKNPDAKLTEKEVLEIRKLLSKQIPQRKIAKQYGVGKTTIARILHRKTWAHI